MSRTFCSTLRSESSDVVDRMLDVLTAPVARGVVEGDREQLCQAPGRGLGRFAHTANFRKIAMVSSQRMDRGECMMLRRNDHLTRVRRHQETPFRLVGDTLAPARIKKAPDLRKDAGWGRHSLCPLPVWSNDNLHVIAVKGAGQGGRAKCLRERSGRVCSGIATIPQATSAAASLGRRSARTGASRLR